MDPTVPRPTPPQQAWVWRNKWSHFDVRVGILARQRDDTLTFALGRRGEGAELFRFPLSRTSIRPLGGLFHLGASMEVSCGSARYFVTFIDPAASNRYGITPSIGQGRESVRRWAALTTPPPPGTRQPPANPTEQLAPAATTEPGRSTPTDLVLMLQAARAAQAEQDHVETDRLLAEMLSGKAGLALRDMIVTLHRDGAGAEIGVMLPWIRAHYPPQVLATLASMLRRADLRPYADALVDT